jgi:hypothetical protein
MTYPSPALLIQSVANTDERQSVRKHRSETRREQRRHVEDGDPASRLKLAIPRADNIDRPWKQSGFKDTEKSSQDGEDTPVLDESHA